MRIGGVVVFQFREYTLGEQINWVDRNIETIKLILFFGFIILGVSSNKKSYFPSCFLTIARIVQDIYAKQNIINFN